MDIVHVDMLSDIGRVLETIILPNTNHLRQLIKKKSKLITPAINVNSFPIL